MNLLATAHSSSQSLGGWILIGTFIYFSMAGLVGIGIAISGTNWRGREIAALSIAWPVSLAYGLIWCVKTAIRIGQQSIKEEV